MENGSREKKMEPVYSKRIRAGKRRTYFFDVRPTRSSDYYLSITESRKRFDENGYDRHKLFLYKEDFNKFSKALNEAIDYVKTDLMPDFDFDSFSHDDYNEEEGYGGNKTSAAPATDHMPVSNTSIDEKPLEAGNNDEKTIENVSPKSDESDTPPTAGSHEEVDKW